ncbi:MAG TPA: hypothetical protein VGM24_08310, partial [Puia sp.]
WINFLFLVLIGFETASCKQNSTKSVTEDTTVNQAIPPPPDNSQATNPSLADTAYPKKDTMITKRDSSASRK